MSTLALLIEGLIRSALITAFAALGWNQLGAADAAGLPHVGFWAILGALTALNAVMFVVGSGLRAGQLRADEVDEQVNA